MGLYADRVDRLLDSELAKIEEEMKNIDVSIERDVGEALAAKFETNEVKKFFTMYYDMLKDKKMESLKNSHRKITELKQKLSDMG